MRETVLMSDSIQLNLFSSIIKSKKSKKKQRENKEAAKAKEEKVKNVKIRSISSRHQFHYETVGYFDNVRRIHVLTHIKIVLSS